MQSISQDDTMDSVPVHRADGKTMAARLSAPSVLLDTPADSPRTIESRSMVIRGMRRPSPAPLARPRPRMLRYSSQDTAAFTLPGSLASASAHDDRDSIGNCWRIGRPPHSDMTTDFGGEPRPSPQKTLPDTQTRGNRRSTHRAAGLRILR